MLSRSIYRVFCKPNKLTWSNSEELAEILYTKYGKTFDPLNVRFTELHRMITELPEFCDDPEKSTEKKLENIQMQWFEMFEDD